MKITKSNRFSSRKTAILATIALLVFAGLCLATYQLLGPNAQKNNDSLVTPVKKDGKDTVEIEDRAIGEVNNNEPTDDEANPAVDNLPTRPNQNTTESIPVTITHSEGSPLQVRAMISEILSTGTCTLSLQKSGQSTVTQTAEIFPATNYTTCRGFTVDTARIAKGAWSLKVTVSAGNRNGSITKEIAIR